MNKLFIQHTNTACLRLEYTIYTRYLYVVYMWQLPKPSKSLLSRKLFETSVFGRILIKIEILLVIIIIVALLFRFVETKMFAFESAMNVEVGLLDLND